MKFILTCFALILCIPFSFAQAPPNDLCANSISLTIEDESDPYVFFDLTGATTSLLPAPIPNCSSNQYQDIWFQVTVPPSGFISIDVNRAFIANGFINYSSLDELTFEAYTGICNGSLSIVVDQLGNCEFDEFNGLYYEGSGTLFIRVFDKNNGQDKFSIAALSVNESQNINCDDAAMLSFDQSCTFQSYATNYATPFSWFKFEYPANTDYVNIQLDRRVFDKVSTLTTTVFTSDCQSLTMLDFYDNTFNAIAVRNRMAGEIIYLRVEKHFSYIGLPFGICVFKKENDICEGAVNLLVNSSCQPISFNTTGSTQSLNPTENINCGFYADGYDAWLKLTVPLSGNVTVEISRLGISPNVRYTTGIEFYDGDCNALNPIYCDGEEFSSSNEIHITPFTNLRPGSQLFIRAMNIYDEGFEVCAYEEASYPEACRVDLVKFVSVDACDPTTNMATAYFEVHYSIPAATSNYTLLFENKTFPLTTNPQIISYDVPAQGQEFFHQNTRILECPSKNYLHFISFDVPDACSTFMPPNDECINAIELSPAPNCEGSPEYTFLNATVSPNNPPFDYSCSFTDEEDIWYTFTTSSSNDLRLYVSRENGYQFFPYLDVYTGSCNNLTAWPNPTCLSGNSFQNALLFQDLPVGQQFFIRMLNCCSDGQGDYHMCLTEECYSNISITTPLANNQFIYKASNQVDGFDKIVSAADVTFQGVNAVNLHIGFEVEMNSVFLANLEGCN